MSWWGIFVRAERRIEHLAGALAGPRTRYLTLLAWAICTAALVVLFPSATRMEAQNPTDLPASAQSVVAGQLDRQAFGGGGTVPGVVVFYRPGGITPTDYQDIRAFIADLDAAPLPLQAGNLPMAGVPLEGLPSLASANGRGFALPILFDGSSDSASLGHLLQDLRGRLRQDFGSDLLSASASGGGLSARFTGPEGIAVDAAGLFKSADVALLAGTTVLILVLLLLIYRSPILPLVPLVGVGLAYAVTSAVLGALARAHLIVIDAETISIMTVLMFGAGTDYTLLIVARYREQLHRQADHLQALRTALGGGAGAVVMSAVTVMLALLALQFAVYGPEHRFAVPFAIGVGITALSALTFTPAVLALLGRAAFYPFVPAPNKPLPAPRGGLLTRLAVTRPVVVAVGATAVLGALAAFAPRVQTSYDLLTALPATSQSREGFDLLSKSYGAGSLSPLTLLVEGGRAEQDISGALRQVAHVQTVGAPAFGSTEHMPVAAYQVTLDENPLSNAAMGVVPALRAAAVQAVGGKGQTLVYVAGVTAQNLDAARLVARDTAVVIPIVLLTISVLLCLYLRSLVAAAYLMATVVLSFGASLGLGWLVLRYVLGVQSWAGGVVLYAFVFLVALGEDYNIFMVSRIWQAA